MQAVSTFQRWGFVLAVSVLLVAAAAAPAAATPAIDWEPCGEDFPGIECATFDVPLDYDSPRGRTTEIALARVPAADTAHRIGSVFVNPGGPGGSGVGLVLEGFGQELHDNLGGRFDVVGFDPRGVGASDPIHCFDSEDDLVAFLNATPLFPYQAGQYRPFYDHWASLADRCLSRDGRIARHMSTADVVRDLDLLRRAVGDRKLTYLGFSYGSYLGNTYANLFPNNVRALVIDGVLDPRLWSSGWQIKSDRVATQEEFDEFLRLCREAGPACAFGDGRRTARRWEALARSVEEEPIDLGDGFLYTYDFLIGDAAGAMYSPEIWGGPGGLRRLPRPHRGHRPRRPVGAKSGATGCGARSSRSWRPTTTTASTRTSATSAPTPSIRARSSSSARSTSTRAPGSRFGPFWWWFNNGCADWPVAPDRYVGPWTARTSAPVLVVGNFFDGVTDYAGAVASSKLLRNARLLSYAGWGHTAYGRSECTTEYVDAYLVSGALPPVGTVCPANPNPFLDVAEARVAAQSAPAVGLPPSWLLRPEPRS